LAAEAGEIFRLAGVGGFGGGTSLAIWYFFNAGFFVSFISALSKDLAIGLVRYFGCAVGGGGGQMSVPPTTSHR